MKISRTEIDEMLERSDETRRKLRRATRELKRFGEQLLAARPTSGLTDDDSVGRSEHDHGHR